MLGINEYWLFILTAILLNLTPGQDTFYILGRSIAQGTTVGVASALGVCSGALFHTALAAAGLSAILATSAFAFTAVKLVGAAYLVYLGLQMIASKSPMARLEPGVQSASSKTAFWQGALTNILNPKVALFFLALMPQFIDPASDTKVLAFTVLGLTFVLSGMLWCLVLVFSAGHIRWLLERRPKVMNALPRVVGGLFIFLGTRLALSRQT